MGPVENFNGFEPVEMESKHLRASKKNGNLFFIWEEMTTFL